MSTEPKVLAVPFQGERYTAPERLSALIAPPYDVISPEERARYGARDPHNIVHVMLPEAAPPDDRYARAAALLKTWRSDAVLARDDEPAVYVMAQDFSLPSGERHTRLGMFAAVLAEPYETRRVRPHERTHAGPKADRLALLRATGTNIESIFLLAPDLDRTLAGGLSDVTKRSPDARADLDSVGIRFWVQRGEAASRLSSLASRLPVYVADGHHRYETAVAYAREHPGTGADRVLAFIVSAQDRGLTILPTHRIVFAARIDASKLIVGWRQWFDVGRVAPCADRVERLAQLGEGGKRTACIVAFPDAYDVSLVLKRDVPLDLVPQLGSTPAVRSLDVARVESLVVQVLLAASGATPSLTYTADPHAAFDAVRKGGAAAAVLLNATRVEQVFAVADAGGVMPQKSTYFVPKVPSGLVLRSLA